MTVRIPAALALLTSCLLAQDPPTPPKPVEPPPPKPIALGEELPKGIELRTIDGQLQRLDELRGKVVVFHFWSTTCPYEKAAEPKLNAIATEFAEKGVVVFGIAANAGEIGPEPPAEAFDEEDPAKRPYGPLRKKAKESGVNHPILVDHDAKLGRALDGRTTPHCFVFDTAGKLQYHGALDDDPRGNKDLPARHVARAVEAVLAGEAPAVPTTRPYG